MAKRRYSTEADPTRERILAAALECISETSAGELSVRAIAARAGVNVATAHYYFRTKDLLVSEALKLFFAPLLSRFDGIESQPGCAREKLEGFLLFYLELLHRHPGVFTSVIEAIIASNIRRAPGASSAPEEVLAGVVGMGKNRLLPLVAEVSGIADGELLALRTLGLMSGIVHPILISSLPEEFFGLDFRKEEVRRRYVRLLVDSLSATASPE